MQKSTLLNERLADKQVRKKLNKEKERKLVMPIIKTADGKLYHVDDDQQVSEEQLQHKVNELQSRLTEYQVILSSLSQPPAEPETPTDNPAPQTTEAVQPEQTPVEQPAEPVNEVVAEPAPEQTITLQ